ncbi:MAG: YggS family pyridoxal phosphate-dependent enzyme [Actinomycetota bacterium]|nr:YggS family pyridoxal phosphate-dependent enzyme [Actinomycetota bacterium]
MSYHQVAERLAGAASRAGRDVAGITLVAVSKTKSTAEIMEVYDQGHRDFGENRAQELVEKVPELPDDIRWHFVGSLQSNKARVVRPVAYLLHSMDRISLAGAWMKGIGMPPPVLVQVNVGDEPQKSGVTVAETPEVVGKLVEMGLEVEGLMAIPPVPESPDDSRRHFAALRDLRDRLVAEYPSVRELSMGMTDDFEVAVEEGASIIRVGRAIFGPRN